MKPTQNALNEMKEYFNYNPANGELRWKQAASTRARPGMRAGRTHENGHIEVRLKNRVYMAHHVAWALTYGEWPNFSIMHENGNKSDNRILNLKPFREVK